MTIECNNGRLKIKYDFNQFIDFIENENQKSFFKSMKEVDGNKDYLKTDYDLNYVAYDEIVFIKNGDWKEINHNIKQCDIEVLFY